MVYFYKGILVAFAGPVKLSGCHFRKFCAENLMDSSKIWDVGHLNWCGNIHVFYQSIIARVLEFWIYDSKRTAKIILEF